MSSEIKVLIIEDDPAFRESLKKMLKRRNFETEEAGSVKLAVALLASNEYDIILLDQSLPDGTGLDILEHISEKYRNRVIIISGTTTIEQAFSAVKQGAFTLLQKPAQKELILSAINKCITINNKLDKYQKLIKGDVSSFAKIICQSKIMKDVIKSARKVARTDQTVLINGETGTGKELFASAIHQASTRHDKPFIVINAASIPNDLAEAELFGYEKGAFTNAITSYPGKFRLADKGTLFLDEVAELPLPLQAKLLRTLDSGEISPLKSSSTIKVNVRLIAATNKDLKEEIKNGNFREDLFFRLDQTGILLPSLRKRTSDIIPLIEHFMELNNIKYSKKIDTISPKAREFLLNYNWPGNIRELKHTVDKIFMNTDGSIISPQNLPVNILPVNNIGLEMPMTLAELECEHITKVLELNAFNIKKTASVLGISRNTLYKKIKDYDISTE